MKSAKVIIKLAAFFICSWICCGLSAQCVDLAKKESKESLQGFVHDGNYNATVISQGENAELRKSFFAGNQYRLVVCRDIAIPELHIQVMDKDRNVLFDNSKVGMVQTWDFNVNTNQILIIRVEVPKNDEKDISGCMAIVFGVK